MCCAMQPQKIRGNANEKKEKVEAENLDLKLLIVLHRENIVFVLVRFGLTGQGMTITTRIVPPFFLLFD